ncbi:MAG: M28 family peptidase [Fidelibacterota bacterium]
MVIVRRIRIIIATSVLLMTGTGLWSQEIPEFDSERSMNYLEVQCDFGPRNPGSTGHGECLQYIINHVQQLADTVINQTFSYVDPYSGESWELTNVLAQFQPELEERIWIATHWDTRPWADRDRNRQFRKTPILGANDGASGVAVLMELANHMKRIPPPVGIDLIFLDGEDLGKAGDLQNFFVGSRYLARNLPINPPKYCILIDMIGDAELMLPMEWNSMRQAPELMWRLWGEAEILGLNAFINRRGKAIEDDHVVLYEEAGIPAVDIIDFDYPNRYLNYWHTLEDTPEKCSSESLLQVGTLLLNHVYSSVNDK